VENCGSREISDNKGLGEPTPAAMCLRRPPCGGAVGRRTKLFPEINRRGPKGLRRRAAAASHRYGAGRALRQGTASPDKGPDTLNFAEGPRSVP